MRRWGWIIFWVALFIFVLASSNAAAHGAEVHQWINNLFSFGHQVAGG